MSQQTKAALEKENADLKAERDQAEEKIEELEAALEAAAPAATGDHGPSFGPGAVPLESR